MFIGGSVMGAREKPMFIGVSDRCFAAESGVDEGKDKDQESDNNRRN
jgi:hypothetical protein